MTTTTTSPGQSPQPLAFGGSEPTEPVSIERDYEARYWARTLQCTEPELREAVRRVGTDIQAVRRFLGPRGASAH